MHASQLNFTPFRAALDATYFPNADHCVWANNKVEYFINCVARLWHNKNELNALSVFGVHVNGNKRRKCGIQQKNKKNKGRKTLNINNNICEISGKQRRSRIKRHGMAAK